MPRRIGCRDFRQASSSFDGERDRKLDAMANTAARGITLQEHLIAQWAFVTVTGRAFDAVINPHPIPSDTRGRPPTTVQFVCYGNEFGYRPERAEDYTCVWEPLPGQVIDEP